jgi:ubiquinone/menaquinone biosynthesis C-methylase UbiE
MELAAQKPYKGIALEGWIARWYAASTRRETAEFRAFAQRIAAGLPPGSSVLEVAPGPGYLAIELSRIDTLLVTGLDISKSFVQIARANAEAENAEVDFREGNAAAMPFDDNVFDRIVCRAAFKNFTEPVRALQEMRRVLRPGGIAVVADLRSDTSKGSIDEYVDGMGLGTLGSFITRVTFHRLRRRAYTPDQMREMVSKAGFRSTEIKAGAIGFEAWLEK